MEASEILDCHPSTIVEAFKIAMIQDYIGPKEQPNPNEANSRRAEANQVKVIHAIHGKSGEDQEPEEVYRSRLRAIHKLKKLSSVNTITSGSTKIGFGDEDLSRVQLPREDPLVINLLVANCLIKKVLVDLSSNANIITKAVFEQLEITPSSVKPTSNTLLGFDGTKVYPIRVIDLSVTVAKKILKKNAVLIEIHPSYNLIMGRGWIYRMNRVSSTLHQMMRYLSPDEKEVSNLWGDQAEAKECYMVTQKEAQKGDKPHK
ncbi:uncharacterized protein LOC132270098 [Cornus florida]|uniref:uncharacterized protein LOC132270098 n=1 Tax=Cornus florida TaxID=4283 RepID=UPI002898D83A|nr:uncharacterized protein LOC132270098 [Cornus florida]